MATIEEIDRTRVPQHVAIIMDGNGRWAMKQQHERIFGHQNALTAVRQAVEGGVRLGVKYMTLYTFSTENWNRPQAEVDGLMELLVKAVLSETEDPEEEQCAPDHDRRPAAVARAVAQHAGTVHGRDRRQHGHDAHPGPELQLAVGDCPGAETDMRRRTRPRRVSTRRPCVATSARPPSPTPTSSSAPAASCA